MDKFKSYANVGIEGGIISPSSTTINQAIYDMCKYIKENAKQGYSIINVQCNKVNTLGFVDYYNLVIDTNEPKTFTYTFTVTNGEKGDIGDTGYYIDNVTIDKISSQGLVDKYKISFHSTNEDTYEIEFNVTNGKSFNWMGEWIANNEYRENDVVYYNGSSYICKSDITGSTTPDTDTANWSIMCKQGIQGESGKAATITIGQVTTLPSGSEATVENVGTNNNAIFNFGIPKGEKGDTGGQEIIDFGAQSVHTTFSITSDQLSKMLSDSPPIVKFSIANIGGYKKYNFSLERIAVYANRALYGGCYYDDKPSDGSYTTILVGMDAHGSTASIELYEGKIGGGLQMQEFQIAANDGTAFATFSTALFNFARSHNIVSALIMSISEASIEFTVQGKSYTMINPTFTCTVAGEGVFSGFIIDTEGTPSPFSGRIMCLGETFITIFDGMNLEGSIEITSISSPRGVEVRVYYQ